MASLLDSGSHCATGAGAEGKRERLPVSPSFKYESPCYVTSCLEHHFSTTFPRILFDFLSCLTCCLIGQAGTLFNNQ